MNTIRLFMWGYQQHFQISVKHVAVELFRTLSQDFQTEVFLLGLRREEQPHSHPVCLEPEDCEFKPEDFASIRQDAEHRYAADPERNIMAMVQSHHDAIQRRVRARNMDDAVLTVLNGWRKRRPGEYSFSGFLPVLNYDVGIVLRVHDPAGHTRYRLPKVHAEERFGAPASLLDAVIGEFHRDCRKALYRPQAEFVADMRERPAAELLRAAGERLLHTPVWASRDMHGLYGLFQSCNIISSLTYEKAESTGGMLVARKDHPNLEFTLTLVEPVALTAYRQIRKLLEMAGTEERLICDGGKVLGFGHVRGNYDQATADLFEVQFTGHYRWELLHGGHSLARVRYGTPELPLPQLNPAKLGEDLQRIFPGATTKDAERLVGFALQACTQRKGALLIISSEAEAEAKRLAKQTTPIEPVTLTLDLVRRLTSIDGALLLSPQGVCYAIGVILDGAATEHGDPGRGARYNSSVRYFANRQNCIAVIVSEDGSAEWIPNLPPRIKRAELVQAQADIEELLAAATLDYRRVSNVFDWLRKHRFYLSAVLCEAANKLVARDQQQRKQEGVIVVSYHPFEPDPAMNDEFLIG